MIRFVYDLLLLLVAPIAVMHLLIRGLLKDRGYWRFLSERFGYGPRVVRPTLWIHAVSFGEMQGAAPLVNTLRERHPECGVLITTFTPTGRARARTLFGDAVDVRYVPFDLCGAVARFLARARPRLVVIMETELWPNLFAACGRRGIPLLLASARLSPRPSGGGRLLVPLLREALSHGVVIGAQTAQDAARYAAAGAPRERIHVTGNAKFDFDPGADAPERARRFRAVHADRRPVWIAGSTHEGEESVVLAAHERLCARFPDALLLLAPRHPHRFAAVAALLESRGVRYVLRSTGRMPDAGCAVLLVDTLGELSMLYGAADAAFVGGSLVPVGGHNLLEPAALGLPLLSGPYTFNAEDIAQLLIAEGGAQVVTTAETLAGQLVQLFADAPARARIGARGKAVVEANRGALSRLLALLAPVIAATLTESPVPVLPAAAPAPSSPSGRASR